MLKLYLKLIKSNLKTKNSLSFWVVSATIFGMLKQSGPDLYLQAVFVET
jgi:hypothetical protein